jgi:SPP1 family predicted phage head-tail adaptor
MINTGSVMRTTIDDLKERIQILSFVNYRNELGDILQSEEVVRAECWAKVLAISAGISEGGVERTASIGYRIIMRYRDDISPDDVIKWRNKRLRITSTPYDAESRRIWTVLDCIEVVPDGKAE